MTAAASDPGAASGCSLLPPAAPNTRRASRAPHLVGRRCASRSRSPARSPRSPCYPDALLARCGAAADLDAELGDLLAERVAVDAEHLGRLHLVAARALGHDLDERRSEERRVGKECRSRWSPYH